VTVYRKGKTDTRIVNIEPGMYIVRFDGSPTLGESAILTIAPGDARTQIDFFASEQVKHSTLASEEDCVVVRCSGGSGNLLITSVSLTSGTLTGARIDRIAAAGSLGSVGTVGQSVAMPSAPTPEQLLLSGHIFATTWGAAGAIVGPASGTVNSH
jgi:hypothetical protein